MRPLPVGASRSYTTRFQQAAAVPNNMQNTLQALRGLQELDQDIFRVSQEVARLPRELEQRRAIINARIAERQSLEQEVLAQKMKVKELEDMTTVQRQRQRKLEGEANASRADASMLAAYQHEIRKIKREVSEAEEEGLQYVEVADQLEARIADIQAAIDEEEKVFVELSANVEKELSEATEKLAGLTTERDKRMSDSIPPDVLTEYEKLLQAREGLAMAQLEDRVCQGCYMGVPANIYVRIARGREIVNCPNCNRILFLQS